MASVPSIINKGASWFSKIGCKGSGGTAIFSVSGHVKAPGNYELPLGIPFKELLELAGGIREGRKLKAVIPGGSSVPVVPGEVIIDMNLDFDSLKYAFGTYFPRKDVGVGLGRHDYGYDQDYD